MELLPYSSLHHIDVLGLIIILVQSVYKLVVDSPLLLSLKVVHDSRFKAFVAQQCVFLRVLQEQTHCAV